MDIPVHASWCICFSWVREGSAHRLGALASTGRFRTRSLACRYSAGSLWSSLSSQGYVRQGGLSSNHPAERLTVLEDEVSPTSQVPSLLPGPPENLRHFLQCGWDHVSLPETGWGPLIKQPYHTWSLHPELCFSELFPWLFQTWRAGVGQGSLGSENWHQIWSLALQDEIWHIGNRLTLCGFTISESWRTSNNNNPFILAFIFLFISLLFT